MKAVLVFLILIGISINSSAQSDIPGYKNNRYVKKELMFKLFYKNNSKITTRGTYIKRTGHKKNLIQINTGHVFPNELDSLYLWEEKSSTAIDTMKAVSINNMFLFNAVTGQIKSYSLVPFTNKSFSLYFQNNNGELYYNTNHFRKKILKDWVSDDAAAFEYWKEYRKRKMIRIFGPIGTIAFGASLAAVFSKKYPDASGLTIVGTNLLWPMWFLIRPIHPSKIIEKYNANKRKNEIFFTE